MKLLSRWFVAGIIAFSLIFGLLVGTSNSPVTGIAISSIFGIVVSFIGLSNKAKESATSSLSIEFTRDKLNAIGKLLVLFSLTFISGVYAGILYRTSPSKKLEREFVWYNTIQPKNTYEAIDWIILQQHLIKLGYSESQIKQLYQVRLKEIKDSLSQYSPSSYDYKNPYSKLLSGQIDQLTEKVGRGPASEP